MRTTNFVLGLGVLLFIGISLILSGYLETLPRGYENASIAEFVVGRWELQESQPTSDYYIRELEFIKPDTLLVDVNFSGGAYYNIPFDYSIISENRIKITGRLSDEWEMEQKGGLLLIRSTWWPSSSSVFVYRRKGTIHWPLVSLTLGVLAIGTLLFTRPQSWHSDIREHALYMKNYRLPILYRSILKYFARLLVFGFGIFVGLTAWSWPPLLRIRVPWDSILTLELSTILLILGIKIIRTNHLAPEISVISARGGWHFLGVLIAGCGILGLGTGLVKLSLFILFGSYLD